MQLSGFMVTNYHNISTCIPARNLQWACEDDLLNQSCKDRIIIQI